MTEVSSQQQQQKTHKTYYFSWYPNADRNYRDQCKGGMKSRRQQTEEAFITDLPNKSFFIS
jgi:hypothetical protein